MEKIGILIDRPDRNQKFYTICKELNKLSERGVDVILFYTDSGRILEPTKFAMMEMSYVFQYDGILVSTDVVTTEIMRNNFNAKKKLFYVWDLEWLRAVRPFYINNNAYNSEIETIARSQSHYDILSRVWKKPSATIEEFNNEQLYNL